ncbi:PA domain-containing protein [Actinobaculum suis]|uniref:PA domain-containing protein n=1 Tax=Actinobaculum suis TaxID=1657 RepID=A0A1G7C0L0_9ACTO|nr:S8 family serine peptidase [Actinobaculum suis]MDY5153115.1 S8 family serine peptidase [Actinobaculum suis]SDE32852.1 PA domain-containing protein [Actinobaculum suis]
MTKNISRHWLAAGATVAVVLSGWSGFIPSASATEPSDATETQKRIDVKTQIQEADGNPRFTGKWFVELGSQPVVRGGNPGVIRNEQSSLSQKAESDGAEVENTFQQIWNGVTVQADSAQIAAIAEDSGVRAIYPVVTVDRPAPVESKAEMNRPGETPDMFSALDATGARLAHETGYTGKGVRIGIIDSGITLDHPAFGGTGVAGTAQFPNAKVVAGYDFVGDAYNGDPGSVKYNPVKTPDAIPNDCGLNGHGTHVAGIAAGNDPASGFSGVAPDAVIGAYRVFGCEGSTDSDIMLDAMEQAAKDKMDVVNMSIGASFATWPNYPTAVAAQNLANSGVTVTVSQGNSGANGIFSGGAPAVAQNVISVGSVDNTYVMQKSLLFDEKAEGFLPVEGVPAAPTSGSLEVAAYPEGQKTGAVDLDGTPFEGKAVLIERGQSTFYQKAIAAQKDGAAAVILYNNTAGFLGATAAPPAGEPEVTIPVVAVTAEQGKAFEAAVAAGKATLTWQDNQQVKTKSPTGGQISDFSSWGLAADLSLKPDVLAPGGNIYSSYPLDSAESPTWASISGTSMAAPHVAGAAAVLLQANPNLDPEQVRAVMQNTAQVQTVDGQPASVKSAVHRQGAGLLDLPAAIKAAQANGASGTQAQASYVTPSKISLGDSDKNPPTTLSLHNASDKAVTYTIGGVSAAVATYGYPDTPATVQGTDAKVSAFPHEVVVQPGQTGTVTVSITEPTNVPKGSIYGGYVVVAGNDGSVSRVPFAGLFGDYENDLQFLHTTWTVADVNPALAKANPQYADTLYFTPALKVLSKCPQAELMRDGFCYDEKAEYDYSPDNGDYVYTLDKATGNYPTLEYHLDSPAKTVEARVYHANEDGTKGEPISPYNVILRHDGNGRTPKATELFWDGTYVQAKNDVTVQHAAPGRYVIELVVTKGLGEASTTPSGKTLPGFTRDANTETYVSHAFCLKQCDVPAPNASAELTAEPSADASAAPSAEPTTGTTPGADPSPTAEPSAAPSTEPSAEPSATLTAPKPQPAHGVFYANAWGQPAADEIAPYGIPGDEMFFGDWDGDGTDTPLVRRGNQFLGTNSRTGVAEFSFFYGDADDQVLVGDWDGDGRDSIAVVRGNKVYAHNTLTSGVADAVYAYGNPGDTLLAGNLDDDPASELVAVRGNRVFVQGDLADSRAHTDFYYGNPTDSFYLGDWNGTGKDSIAVRRGNTFFLKNELGSGRADATYSYGNPTDSFYVGDWNGDGTATPAVNRR